MVRTALAIATVLAIAIIGGAGSVWLAMRDFEGFGALELGQWTAYPDTGTPAADPYARARFARDAELPLGRAEGLSFTASRDAAGAALRLECTYRIEGAVPVSRFWTLYASRQRTALPALPERAAGLHSRQIVRHGDDSFEITSAPNASPGNWLRTSGVGDMSLVLTLYDTPIAGGADGAGVQLPLIYRTACDG